MRIVGDVLEADLRDENNDSQKVKSMLALE